MMSLTRAHRLEKVAFFGALSAVLLFPIWPLVGRSFTPDSYAYALLGSRLWSAGEYSSLAIREFAGIEHMPQISRSFPPLWPALLGFAQTLAGTDILSGPILSVLTLFLSVALLGILGERLRAPLGEPMWLLVGFACFAFLDDGYSTEIGAGRSMGLLVLLYIGLLVVLVCALQADALRTQKQLMFVLGVCAGWMALTRYDQTLFVAGLLLAIAVYKARTVALMAALGCFVALLPWLVRNLLVFHTPWTSDNVATVRSLYPGEMGFAFFAPGQEPGTFSTSPLRWALQRAVYLRLNLVAWCSHSHYLAILAVPVAALSWKRSPPVVRWLLGVLGWHMASSLATLSLTPYRFPRYFTTAHLEVWFVLALALAQWLPAQYHLAPVRRWGMLTVLALGLISCGLPTVHPVLRAEEVPARAIPLKLAESLPESQPILVGSDEAERFAWFTGKPSIYVPHNALGNPDGFAAWLRHFRPTHIAVPIRLAHQLGLSALTVRARAEDWVLIETGLRAPPWIPNSATWRAPGT